ncbi:MAG: aminotransferase class I/II-fold pyridoxal phosphate-dependent enzyme, partial [Limisphaerales bacterium]
GRRLSYFSGCDYFRLASHPDVLAALRAGLKQYGLNVAASRMTTGNHRLYAELEARLAGFMGAESALLLPSGYLSNLAAAQALAGTFSHALIDEKAHPSLSDAVGMLECPVLRFKHRDPEDVGRAFRRCGPQAWVVLCTDGMFAHDGSVAPLRDYLRVLPKDALLLVDDAHGAGVLGRTGKGSLELTGVSRSRVLQTITLSKAFGVYGGAILGPKSMRRLVIERSQLFIGSTPLPLPLVSAALTSVRILRADKTLRKRMAENVVCLRKELGRRSWVLPETPGPILALRPGTAHATKALNRSLLRSGIYPPYIRYPGGPEGGYFRFVISSEHTRAQLDRLVQALARVVPRPGL